jgi:hypothetical protein
LLQLHITLGLILSIAGGSGGDSNNGVPPKPETTSKIGIILYIVAFVGICFVWGVSTGSVGAAPGNKKRISAAVIVALPFILVRLVYSALLVFVHNKTFNIFKGSVAVHAAMGVIEEFVVLGIYLALGFVLRPLQAQEQGEIASRPWKENKGQRLRFRAMAGSDRRPSRERGANAHSGQAQHGVVYPAQVVQLSNGQAKSVHYGEV